MSRDGQYIVMKIKSEEVDFESEPEAASSSNEPKCDVKIDPERQWLECLNNDAIKKEPLGRTCEKCGRVTMVKNHKCDTRCKICDKKLKTKTNLIRHMQNVHRAEPDCKFFECDFCSLRLLQKHFLIRHLKLKHEGGKIEEFQCDYDRKTFMLKSSLYTHMKNCHCAASKCEICGKVVKSMKEHIRLMHPVEKITVACKICSKGFKNKKVLAGHLKNHNKQFECRVCNQKFGISSNLKKHLKIHDNPGAFQCKICYKGFNQQSHLTSHLKVHDKNRIKDLKCTKCDYVTDNKQHLKNHINTHNPHRTEFPCPQCDYKATRLDHLKTHIRIHNPDRFKDQKCTHCNYATDQKQNLRQHTERHHKKRVKNFKCSTCEKSFYQKYDFEKHMEITQLNLALICR
jgi:KRAB domain-containing zinc finger protein